MIQEHTFLYYPESRVLKKLTDDTESPQCIFWLSGLAGAGKSVITLNTAMAHT